MAACPNCGRRTLRTKDWVCQWCGYPLLYGSYKPIDKTYKELQEERNPSYQAEETKTEPDIEYEPEPESEPEPKPEPQWKLKRPPKPAYPPKSERTTPPKLEAEITPEPKPAPKPQPRPAPQPGQEILPRPRPEPVMLPKPEPAPQPAPRPEAEIAPEPVPQPTLRPAQPAPPREEPQPEPVTVPSLESIKDGTQLTIDQIDALFRADNVGANIALKDKTLVIKGIVNKVFIRDHIDVRYLILTGARKVIWSARCSFEKESVPQMSRLSEGQAVALRGKYEGYSKNIIFKDCELVGS